MELEFDRDTIIGYETAAEMTLCQEETLESIVPDACPDILRIVDVCGQAELRGKQARENSAVVSGFVRATILYLPEGQDGVRRMEVGLPFTCQLEAPGLSDRGVVLASPRLRSAEARALNPRKVLLRVDLAVDIKACQPVERTVCRGVLEDEENTICQRQFQGETYLISTIQEKNFTFSERVRVPSGQSEAGQLMALRAQPICTESKLIGSKLIFKGAVELSMLLQEAGGNLVSSHESLPFSQVMEVSGAGEENDCEISVELSDVQWETLLEEHGILEVTLELIAQAQVRGRRPVTLLQDLYSTFRQMEVDNEKQLLWQQVEQSVRPQAIRELLETGELVRSVVDSRLALGPVSQSREGNQLILNAETWITVLYLDEQEQLQCIRNMIPVSLRMECPAEHLCSCTSQCQGEVFAAPGAGGVEVRFTLEFHCRTQRQLAVSCVKYAKLGDVRHSEPGDAPSLILRLATPGEGLWELAKTYGTTREQILQANELTEEELPEGKMLLIPKVR